MQTTIHGTPVTILIDRGSSDNFLHPRFAKFLKLEVHRASPMRVMAGDGSRIQVEGMIKDLNVLVKGLYLRLLMYLLHVAGTKFWRPHD